MQEQDQKLADKVTAALDEKLQSTDARTLQGINLARRTALAGQRKKAPGRSWWLPLGSATAVACSVLVVVSLLSRPDSGEVVLHDELPLELLASQDELEFYEDLDFYLWLERQDDNV